MGFKADRGVVLLIGLVLVLAAWPGLAAATDAGIAELDGITTKVQNFATSKFVVLAAAVAFIGGLISFVAGGEWNIAMQATFRFAFVASLIVGLASVLSFFGVAGAVLR